MKRLFNGKAYRPCQLRYNGFNYRLVSIYPQSKKFFRRKVNEKIRKTNTFCKEFK
ncbi:MAG: hypothetical protein LBJ00_03350 [Planctomycetaceae bacterium]|nr:hypothetical protein [Planctomycetaceae bacterium]